MRNILTQFEATAARVPDKKAIADQNESFTFGELQALARRVGAAIGTGEKNRPVGVLAARDIRTPAFFLGALYSGNYYVPIDPDMPPEKKQAILDETGMTVILGTEENRALLEPLRFDGVYLTQDIPGSECAVLLFPDVGGSVLNVMFSSLTAPHRKPGSSSSFSLIHTVSGCAAFIFRMAAFRFLSQLRIWISSSPCSKNRCVSFFALGIFITSLREYFSAPPFSGIFQRN